MRKFVDDGPRGSGALEGGDMTRTSVGRRPSGLRITPDDIRDCFTFLRRAALLVQKGLPGTDYGPCAPRRTPGRTAGPFRRRA